LLAELLLSSRTTVAGVTKAPVSAEETTAEDFPKLIKHLPLLALQFKQNQVSYQPVTKPRGTHSD
jgi:hypothetical protein